MSEKRFNAALADRLEDPERLQWLPPAEVIAAISVQQGEVIADIGAGTGFFSFPLAVQAGPSGTVYAIDSQQEMLDLLRKKMDRLSVPNIELVRTEGDATGLPDHSCDLVLLANVWHEVPDTIRVLAEASRILKHGGRIAIVDWSPDAEPEHGPPLSHRISVTSAVAEMIAAGFIDVSSRSIGRYSWLVQAKVQAK